LRSKTNLCPHLGEADWVRDRYLRARVGYVVLSTPDSRSSGPKERRGILELTKPWRIAAYYARPNDTRPSTAHVDRVGLVLKYFR